MSSAPSAFGQAVRQGLRAARQNLPAMLALEGVMAALVASYYLWPAATSALSRFAIWQQQGGFVSAGLATAIAGGLLSEISVVYFQDRGRWTPAHIDNAAFKFVFFLVNGIIVYEFYRQQAVWFGNGPQWSVLVPKILVDQLGFTVVWSTPSQTLLTRWHALRYSFPRLRRELDRRFLLDRMLPMLVANWMMWIPAVTLIYSLPQNLQTPLFIFATAIWSILLSSVARQATGRSPASTQDILATAAAP